MEGLRFAHLLEAAPVFINVGADTSDRRQTLTGLIQAAGKTDVDPSMLLIRSGDPYSVIRTTARELQSEMIILGALSRDPVWDRVWGSVARKIARTAPCSVLLLSSPTGHRAGDRIVVGIGLDMQSAAAMPMILQLARQGPSESVHFVREFANLESRWGDNESANPLESEEYLERERAEQYLLADFLSGYDLSGLNVRIAALPGREGMQVAAYARRHHADLMILSAPRKRLTIWDRFFRHPLENVLMDLPCALLLQRANETDVSAKGGAKAVVTA